MRNLKGWVAGRFRDVLNQIYVSFILRTLTTNMLTKISTKTSCGESIILCKGISYSKFKNFLENL